MNNLIKSSLQNAFGTAAYVVLIVTLMSNLERFVPKEDNIFMPMSALMLFVLSAAITGSLVIGKPIMWYLNGQKVEAVKLFVYTIGWLALFTVVAFIISALV